MPAVFADAFTYRLTGCLGTKSMLDPAMSKYAKRSIDSLSSALDCLDSKSASCQQQPMFVPRLHTNEEPVQLRRADLVPV